MDLDARIMIMMAQPSHVWLEPISKAHTIGHRTRQQLCHCIDAAIRELSIFGRALYISERKDKRLCILCSYFRRRRGNLGMQTLHCELAV